MDARVPFFSVIVPAYNRGRLIRRTLESVLAQTFDSYEIIVVDNCSTDDTVAVVERYTGTGRVRLIRHERNLERAMSRNTGMEAATGEFVTFLDSDDLMLPDNLSDAHAHATADGSRRFFHNLYELADEQGRPKRGYRFPALRAQRRAIAEGNFLSCIGVFMHRSLYARHRFDPDPALAGSEDWELWLRVLASETLTRIPRVNSRIVDHSARTMRHQEVEAVRDRLERIIRKVFDDPYLARVYAPHRRRMVASSHVFVAGVANAAALPGRALRALGSAVASDPSVVLSLRFARTLQLAILGQLRGGSPVAHSV